MAQITNNSNADIKDRPVNGRSYTILGGQTIKNVPEDDAAELVGIYGFLSKSAEAVVVVEEPKVQQEKALELAPTDVVPAAPVVQGEAVVAEVVRPARRRRSQVE